MQDLCLSPGREGRYFCSPALRLTHELRSVDTSEISYGPRNIFGVPDLGVGRSFSEVKRAYELAEESATGT